jgi:hypothetical protein
MFIRMPSRDSAKSCVWSLEPSIGESISAQVHRLTASSLSRKRATLSDAEKCKRTRFNIDCARTISTDSDSDVDILRSHQLAEDSDSCPSTHGDADSTDVISDITADTTDLFPVDWSLIGAAGGDGRDYIDQFIFSSLPRRLSAPSFESHSREPSFEGDAWETCLLELV